jgi:polynucleotide 5'-kinase involved in rRNA processing
MRRDPRFRAVEMSVSPHVTLKSREFRIARRRERMERYLAGARDCPVDLRRYAVYDLERLAPGALLAFLDDQGFALGLGVVREADRQGARIVASTPLTELDEVRGVRFGAGRWDLESRQELRG